MRRASQKKMYLVYMYCVIFSTTGRPSIIQSTRQEHCFTDRWGELCPTDDRLQALQTASETQLNAELEGLQARIDEVRFRHGGANNRWVAEASESTRRRIASTQIALNGALDDMNNETRHLSVRADDLQPIVEDTAAISRRSDDFVWTIDDTIRHIMGKLNLIENSCGTYTSKASRKEPNAQKCQIAVTTGKDCAEIYRKGARESGIYFIRPPNSEQQIQVYCDMEDKGGGWTVIQRRFDGSVSFDRDWEAYKFGFGQKPCAESEYWLGNEYVHRLTSERATEMKIDLQSWDDEERYAIYKLFQVDSEENNYALKFINGYFMDPAGDIKNAFEGTKTSCRNWSMLPSRNTGHKAMLFSTKDRDNDRFVGHCAGNGRGGWWYNQCGSVNLNGKRRGKDESAHLVQGDTDGMVWITWKGCWETLKQSTMKIRPFGFRIDNANIVAPKSGLRRRILLYKLNRLRKHNKIRNVLNLSATT